MHGSLAHSPSTHTWCSGAAARCTASLHCPAPLQNFARWDNLPQRTDRPGSSADRASEQICPSGQPCDWQVVFLQTPFMQAKPVGQVTMSQGDTQLAVLSAARWQISSAGQASFWHASGTHRFCGCWHT